MNPRLHKILAEEVPRVGRLKVAIDTSDALATKVAAWLKSERGSWSRRDPNAVAFVVVTVVEALTHRVVIDRPDMITTSQLEVEATDLVAGYLLS